MKTFTHAQPSWHSCQMFVATCLALAILLLVGCGKAEVNEFDSYLDQLDVDASLDSAEEIVLGTYNIASALPKPESPASDEEEDEENEPLWVQVRFELYAIVAPEDKKAVAAACERHRGMLDDTVVTICREASKDELDDSRWATLKSRLIDAIRPILGDDRVRQLSFSDFAWEPI
ncbi:MAG: hypothetical protein SH868_09765 [Bythopirellula sp.]|nr:hypothetical protein [Bythopirellula sp.]